MQAKVKEFKLNCPPYTKYLYRTTPDPELKKTIGYIYTQVNQGITRDR